MAARSQGKTKEYTLRANDNYRAKHDFLNITLDKGEKEKFYAVGLDNKAITALARAEYQRRIGEVPEPDTKNVQDTENKNPMPKPQSEIQEDIPFFE